MATREEKIRVAILGAADGKRDLDRLARAADGLGDEFSDLARDAGKLDRKIDELKTTQRGLAAEFARTGDASIGKKLRAVTAEISTTLTARKALVGDVEAVLDEADRASDRRARAEKKRLAEVADATRKAAAAAKRASDESRRGLARRAAGAGSAALGLARGVAGPAAGIAGIASLAGPAISGMLGLAKAVAAVGKGLATLPPLVATLPALVGGFALVMGTLKLAGPAIGKALTPIGEAFKAIEGRIGAIGSKGLPEFARGFVKVNFPSISRAMDSIAGSTNRVLVATGAWINSLSGQQAIQQVTAATSAAAKSLEGPISRVAISFGEMVKRLGGRAITGAADAMGRLADATVRWMDSIDNSDITLALQSLSGWGAKLKDTFFVLRDIGVWMAENEGRVKKFSDVLATAAIGLGLATGNLPAVLAGTFALVVNHWEDLKNINWGALQQILSGVWSGIRNDPNVAGIWESMKVAWQGLVDSFRRGTADIGPKVKAMIVEWKKVWDEWGPIIKAWWDAIGKPIFSALGSELALRLQNFVTFAVGAGRALAMVGQAIKILWQVFSEIVGLIINGAAKAFGWVPGIGPKLQRAAADFNAFRDRVNGALSGIKDQDVFVNVKIRDPGRALAISNNFQSGIGGRAGGGPIWKGQTYLTGEEGPELITAQRNGFVHTADRTRQMIGGSGGGGAGVIQAQLVASGGNTAVAELLHYLVRVGALRLKVVNNRVVPA